MKQSEIINKIAEVKADANQSAIKNQFPYLIQKIHAYLDEMKQDVDENVIANISSPVSTTLGIFSVREVVNYDKKLSAELSGLCRQYEVYFKLK